MLAVKYLVVHRIWWSLSINGLPGSRADSLLRAVLQILDDLLWISFHHWYQSPTYAAIDFTMSNEIEDVALFAERSVFKFCAKHPGDLAKLLVTPFSMESCLVYMLSFSLFNNNHLLCSLTTCRERNPKQKADWRYLPCCYRRIQIWFMKSSHLLTHTLATLPGTNWE